MSHYYYECFDCESQYTASQIEDHLVYLCPACGLAERSRPLKGVLKVKYDFHFLKRKIKKEDFFYNNAFSLLFFPWLLPLKSKQSKSSIKYPGISEELIYLFSRKRSYLQKIKVNNRWIGLLDDTKNLTLSYKDRASILVVLKALQSDTHTLAAASTGNAGSSLAGICSAAGLKSNIFVPASIPDEKRIQIQSYGATLITVDGTYDDAFDLCLSLAARKGWYNRNTAYNPLTIEGKKSGAYDIYFETRGNIPDYIFISVGDGVILSGIYKGFSELKKLGLIKKIPALLAVQAFGSKALINYLNSGEFKYRNSYSVADSIVASAPRNLYMAADAVIKSGGFGITVTDSQILQAQKRLSSEFGLLVEPAAAAGLAAFLKLERKKTFKDNDKILFLATGHGFKDVRALNTIFKGSTAGKKNLKGHRKAADP